MWTFIARRVLYSVPVFLGIVLLLMAALRVNDPLPAMLGKHEQPEDYARLERALGLDRPFLAQYAAFLGELVTLDFSAESYDRPGLTCGEILREALPPTLSITLPALVLSTLLSLGVALVSASRRGRPADRILVLLAALGLSVSFPVYVIFGQHFGAFRLNEWLGPGRALFAIEGYATDRPGWWLEYCLLPVLISVVVALGYDSRFYRAVIVAESGKDYVTTALAKGATERRAMCVHVLRNALIPVITHVMITLPFLITGSFLLETYFNIPGMGSGLIHALNAHDFPVIQMFGAVFAVLFLASNLLTDVAYALVDPRVRLP